MYECELTRATFCGSPISLLRQLAPKYTGDLLFDQSLFFLIETEKLLKKEFFSKQMPIKWPKSVAPFFAQLGLAPLN